MPAPGAGSFAVPGQLDHFLWRLVGTDRLKGARDLLELDERWSYTDMLDAHVWLDAIDDAVAREHAEHERAMRAAAPRRR